MLQAIIQIFRYRIKGFFAVIISNIVNSTGFIYCNDFTVNAYRFQYKHFFWEFRIDLMFKLCSAYCTVFSGDFIIIRIHSKPSPFCTVKKNIAEYSYILYIFCWKSQIQYLLRSSKLLVGATFSMNEIRDLLDFINEF